MNYDWKYYSCPITIERTEENAEWYDWVVEYLRLHNDDCESIANIGKVEHRE